MTETKTSAEKTAPNQRGKPFAKGQSGNPAGKPKGARHRVSLAVEALLEGEAEGLTRKVIELALAGDVTALRVAMDRIAPVPKERLVSFEMPAISTAADVPSAIAALMEAVANGDLAPGEAATLTGIVDRWRGAYELTEIERRLTELEAAAETGSVK